MNIVCLIGRISTEIDLKALQDGKFVAKFNLAVDHGFGEKKRTSFIPIVVWGKTAENTANYSGKGKQVGVTGYMQIRSYDANDGQRRTVAEVVADSVQFLSPRDGSQPVNETPELPPDDQLPF